MHPRTAHSRLLLASALLGAGAMILTSCASEPENAAKPRPAASEEVKETPVAQEQTPTQEERERATQALFEAVTSGDAAAARLAIESGADLEARGPEGRTPLVVATKANNADLAILLLDKGADPNAQDDMLDSAFLYAGAEGYDEILVATLGHGADVTATNRYGGTALIPASEHGHTSTARILIEAGVPLDHVNNLGWTALHEAIVLGTGSPDHLDVVSQLLAAGASPTLPDGNGTAPRDLALGKGFTQIAAEIDRYL